MARPFSFSSAKELYARIEVSLNDYSGPRWYELPVTLDEVPNETYKMWLRDVQECADYLFGNPPFRGQMGYSPIEIQDGEGKGQVYNEAWTGTMWDDLQVGSLRFEDAWHGRTEANRRV